MSKGTSYVANHSYSRVLYTLFFSFFSNLLPDMERVCPRSSQHVYPMSSSSRVLGSLSSKHCLPYFDSLQHGPSTSREKGDLPTRPLDESDFFFNPLINLFQFTFATLQGAFFFFKKKTHTHTHSRP